MAHEESMIYHCWASVSPMHASSSPPIVAYSAKDGGAGRAGRRQRGRCGGSTERCATDFKHLGCTGLIGLAQQYNAPLLIQVRGKRSKPQRNRAKQRRRQQQRQKKKRKEEQRRKSSPRKERKKKRQKKQKEKRERGPQREHQPEGKQEEQRQKGERREAKRRSRNC